MAPYQVGIGQNGSDQAVFDLMNYGMIHAATSSVMIPLFRLGTAGMIANEDHIAPHMQNSVICHQNQNNMLLRIGNRHETLIKSRNGPWLTCGDSYALGACRPNPSVIVRNATYPGQFGLAGVFRYGINFHPTVASSQTYR